MMALLSLVPLLLRYLPAIAGVVLLAWFALWVRGLQASNDIQRIALQKLGERAAQLHQAHVKERATRLVADESNRRLGAKLRAQRTKAVKRDRELAALAQRDPAVREWRSDRVAGALDKRLRDAYASATGGARATGATAHDRVDPVPGTATAGR